MSWNQTVNTINCNLYMQRLNLRQLEHNPSVTVFGDFEWRSSNTVDRAEHWTQNIPLAVFLSRCRFTNTAVSAAAYVRHSRSLDSSPASLLGLCECDLQIKSFWMMKYKLDLTCLFCVICHSMYNHIIKDCNTDIKLHLQFWQELNID